MFRLTTNGSSGNATLVNANGNRFWKLHGRRQLELATATTLEI